MLLSAESTITPVKYRADTQDSLPPFLPPNRLGQFSGADSIDHEKDVCAEAMTRLRKLSRRDLPKATPYMYIYIFGVPVPPINSLGETRI